MEDLWRLQAMDYRVAELVDQAEYARMLKRFREEEEGSHRHQLLFRGAAFGRSDRK